MFELVTDNVLIRVFPAYIKEQSNPSESYYFFAYQVSIINQSLQALQLLRRHWIITDAQGNVEEVEGEGVVGQKPTLNPGEQFQYTSFCPLPTPTGHMQGRYFFSDPNGQTVEIKIPQFFLCEPGHYH